MSITHRSIIPSALAGAAIALSLSAIAAPGVLPTPVGPLKLTKTFIDAGTMSGASLPGSVYTTVGTPVEVTCAVATGCTVSASLEAQVGQVGANTVSLCFFVDGTLVTCPSNDRLSSTVGFKVMSHQSSTRITPDVKHKLEMRAYSEQPNQLYRYQAEYRIFNK
jgi:hypothetical protein